MDSDSVNKDIIMHGLLGYVQLETRRIRAEIDNTEAALAGLQHIDRVVATVIEMICTPPDQIDKFFSVLDNAKRDRQE